METTILKPCPFCGSYDVGITNRYYTVFDDQYYCFCSECGAHTTYKLSQKKAIEAWNRRGKDD